MPINPKLKEHFEKNVQMDDAYRKRLLETLEDAPAEVQNAWMSNQDYQRNMVAFKEEQTKWKTKADDFYETSNKNIKAWQDEVKAANDAKAALEAQIADLKAAGPGTGTPAENDALVKKITTLEGLVTKVQGALDDRLKNFVSAPDLDKAYGNAVGFIGEQVLTLNEISAQHQERFGKRLTKQDNTELITFANEESKKLGHALTLEQAYERKYGGDIKKLEREQIEREAIEKYKSTHEVPGAAGPTGPGGGTEKGPLQIRLDQLRAADGGKKEGVYADWREAAAAGADELVKEGKY